MEPTPTQSEISAIMGCVVEACEEQLRRDPATASLVPVASAFGRRSTRCRVRNEQLGHPIVVRENHVVRHLTEVDRKSMIEDDLIRREIDGHQACIEAPEPCSP